MLRKIYPSNYTTIAGQKKSDWFVSQYAMGAGGGPPFIKA